MYIGLHVMYLSFLLDCNQTSIFLTDFRNITQTKFRENLSSGSRVVSCRRADTQMDTMKLTVAFCNFANTPKNGSI